MATGSSRFPSIVLNIALYLFMTGVLALQLVPAMVDDAFIYLKVATNLVEGNGWSFNPAEHVNPCTGPLYVLFLAGALLLGLPGILALLVNFWIPFSAAGALLYVALRPRGEAFRLTALALFLSTTALITSLGLETAWFVFFIILAAFSYDRGWRWPLALSLAALPLLRLDGLALLGIIMGLALIERRRLPVLAPALTVALFGISAYLEWRAFGDWLPHSVRVKVAQSSHPNWAQSDYLQHFLSRPLAPFATWTLAALGAWFLTRETAARRFLLPIVLFGVLQTAVYSLSKAPVGYYWYMVPGLLGGGLLLLIGLTAISALLLKRSGVDESPAVRAISGALVAILALALNPGLRSRDGTTPGKEYLAITDWAAKHLPKSYEIASAEIGYLGYYGANPIIDMHGLIHADLEAVRSSEYWWFERYHPQAIVVHSPVWPGEPRPEWPAELFSRFQRDYRPCLRGKWTVTYLSVDAPEISQCEENGGGLESAVPQSAGH